MTEDDTQVDIGKDISEDVVIELPQMTEDDHQRR